MEQSYRKFEKVVKSPDKFSINTPQGWKPIRNVMKTVPYEVWNIELENGDSLKCADTHIVYTDNHKSIYVCNVKIGQNIETDDGYHKCVKVENLGYEENMYDVEVDSDEHEYYSNNFVSHNTTCSAIFLLWYALFHKSKTVAILANKADNAKAILAEIKYAYEKLPEYLKAGAAEYNAFNVKFDNNSEIICRATSPDALRSLSVSLLMLDEFAFVQPNIADQFWASNYPTISCIPKDTFILTDNGFEEIGDYIPENSKKGDYIEIDDLSVYGKNGIEKASHFYVSPKSKTKILRTRYGLKHESTLDHPIITLDNKSLDMKKSSDIVIGDYVRVDYNMNIYGNSDEINYHDRGVYNNGKSYNLFIQKLDKEIGYLIGGYIAEGWTSQKQVYISNTEDEFRNVYLNSDIFNFKPTKSSVQKLQSDQGTYKFFDYILGDVVYKKCYEKTVPKHVLQASRDVQEGFIAGYIDGNGSVLQTGDTVISSSSEKLLMQVQMMLLNMGIISKLKSLKDRYHLTISREFSDKLSTIGLKIQRKLDILEKTHVSEQDKNKQFKIPLKDVIYKEILLCFDKSGKTQKYFQENGVRIDKIRSGKSKHINVEWLKRFVMVCGCHSELFDSILSTPCFFDEIVSIEDNTNDTYDLTCPETHTFLQNGIMGSNTGGSIIVVSTPQGTANLYYRLWKDAVDGNNSFVPLRVNWREVPTRDENWYKETIKNIGKIQFLQEYECIFRKELVNIKYNGMIYEVKIGDLYDQGKDLLQTLQSTDESDD